MFLFASTSYPVRRLPLLSLRCFFFFSCTKRQFIQSNYRLFIDPFRHTSFDHAKKRRKIKKKSILYILKCLFENIPSRKRPFFHYNKIFNRKNKLLSQLCRISPAFANETGTPEKLYRKSVRFLLIIALCKAKRKKENGALMVKS